MPESLERVGHRPGGAVVVRRERLRQLRPAHRPGRRPPLVVADAGHEVVGLTEALDGRGGPASVVAVTASGAQREELASTGLSVTYADDCGPAPRRELRRHRLLRGLGRDDRVAQRQAGGLRRYQHRARGFEHRATGGGRRRAHPLRAHPLDRHDGGVGGTSLTRRCPLRGNCGRTRRSSLSAPPGPWARCT